MCLLAYFCKLYFHKIFIGRGERIRTFDFYLPKVALYQAELHPVIIKAGIPVRLPSRPLYRDHAEDSIERVSVTAIH